MRENDWTKVLVSSGHRVYQYEITEPSKILKLWVRRSPGEPEAGLFWLWSHEHRQKTATQ